MWPHRTAASAEVLALEPRLPARSLAASSWISVRLELARTPEYPVGSASRAYLLHLPLDQDGLIDEAALGDSPSLATVRRFWPGRPDLSGYVIRTSKGWAFSYKVGEDDDETVFHLETHPIRIGEYVTLTEPSGERLPFRVARLRELY
jgi:hypothetical protein